MSLTASVRFLLAKLKAFLLRSEPRLVGTVITMRGKMMKAKCLHIKFQEYKFLVKQIKKEVSHSLCLYISVKYIKVNIPLTIREFMFENKVGSAFSDNISS